MPEINAKQFSIWSKYLFNWENVVRPKIKRAKVLSEIAASLQNWVDLHGFLFLNIFSKEDRRIIDKLLDDYNRIDNSNSTVLDGVYGLKFEGSEIDIIAPLDMPSEEYIDDQITFGIGPLIWVGILGVVIIGSLFGVSTIMSNRPAVIEAKMKRNLVAAHKEIMDSSPEIVALYSKLLDDNKEQLEEAGLLGDLLGVGSGKLIAAAIGIGVLLFAFMRGRKS